MQCQNCGLNNAPGASFCKQCGRPLAAPPVAPPPAYPQSAPPPPMPSSASQPYAPGPAPLNVPPPYPPSASPNPQVQQANWGAPSAWNAPPAQPGPLAASTRRIQKISAVSVLKVVAAIYGLMYAVFAFLFLVLPGILGAGILDSIGRGSGFGGFGGASIIVILLVYVISIAIAGLSAGVLAAIGALIYNLVVRYIGGIEVEVA